MLLGREGECSRIHALLAAARSGVSGVLVIRGEPGIGKTALLDYAESRAAEMRVLRARGAEPESELAFAGLSQLLLPLMGALDVLPPPPRAALAAALGLGPPVPGDPMTVSLAALGLLAAAAEPGPVVVLVDDAHWLDRASLQSLLFAARRLGAEGIALLLTGREGAFALDSAGLPELELRPLSEDAARDLLGRASPGMASDVVEAVVRTAEGNPLALVELPRLLSNAQIAGHEPLPDPLPPSSALGGAFLRRAEGLDASTRTALLLAAAAGTDDADAVLRSLAFLGLAARVLEPAEAAGLFELGAFRFRHPIVRSAVYFAASAPERRQAHATLAAAYGREDGGRRRAWHLALAAAGPDDEVADALEAAALDARLRTAHAAAADAFERAARLTPERPPAARRLVEAASDLQLAGHLPRAAAILEEALSLDSKPDVRATIFHLLGRGAVFAGAPPEGVARMLEAAAILEERDPGRAATTLAEVVVAALAMGDARSAVAHAARAVELAEVADEEVRLLTSLELVQALLVTGRVAEAERRFDRLLPALSDGAALRLVPWALHVPLLSLVYLERFDEARSMVDRVVGAIRARSAPGLLPVVLYSLGELEFRTGNWTRGLLATTETVELAQQTGQGFALAYGLALHARYEAVRGRDAECRRLAGEALAVGEAFMNLAIRDFAHTALARLALARGETTEVVTTLETVARDSEERGIQAPSILQWEPDLIEAYVRLGREGDAVEALARLERVAAQTGRPWTAAVVARGRGVLADNAEFERHFGEAVRLHGGAMPFERARTELSLGERRRRAGRRSDAREPLRSALATFERLGAAPWAERARAELRATGESRRAPQPGPLAALTPHELRVALAVAEGATNREVAAALFLSPKTVDFHLRGIFQKLGIRSRSQLAALVAREKA